MKKSVLLAAAFAVVSVSAPSIGYAQKSPDVNYDCALFDECGEKSPSVAAEGATEGPVVRSSGNVRGGFTMRRDPVNAQSAKPATPTTSRPSASVAQRPARIAKASGNAAAPSGRMQSESIRAAQQITFVSGSATLSPNAKLVAQKLATAMLRPDKASIRYRIEGHTDAVGTRDRNLELSKQRAQSVVMYLATLGVDDKKLEPVGLGFDQPLAGVSKTSAANRRVVAKPIS